MTALEFLKQFPNYADFSRKSKLLLFAFYLRKHMAQVEFGAKDLRDCFHAAMLRISCSRRATAWRLFGATFAGFTAFASTSNGESCFGGKPVRRVRCASSTTTAERSAPCFRRTESPPIPERCSSRSS